MTRPAVNRVTALVLANCISLAIAGMAQAQGAPPDGARLDALEKLVSEQARQIEKLQHELAGQEENVAELQRALAQERLDDLRGAGAESTAATAMAAAPLASPATRPSPMPGAPDSDARTTPADATQARQAVAQATGETGTRATQRPVGRAPREASQPPEVARIFEQPGVLTPRGKFVLEPSVQFGYSSNDRVALIGYTVIPALLIGLIDVRQVKTSTATAALTSRYGVTNRFELEARVPYVHVNTDTISREIFTGTSQDRVFNANGSGLGDVEMTARYQINRGGANRPFYVGWVRYKSRTGKDPFEIVTDCVTRCAANTTGTGLPLELPTGSGFESIQPGLTWLYASDPVVFFGSFSYLHNLRRSNVSRTVLSGAPPPNPQTTTELIGEMKAGDIIGLNLGLGLALNEKAALSLGYDQSIVGRTQQNGRDAPGAVRLALGTLLLGGSYRFSERTSLNVALGVGVTRDTPDVSLMVRVPMAF